MNTRRQLLWAGLGALLMLLWLGSWSLLFTSSSSSFAGVHGNGSTSLSTPDMGVPFLPWYYQHMANGDWPPDKCKHPTTLADLMVNYNCEIRP